MVSVGKGRAALSFWPAPRLADGIWYPLFGYTADRDRHGAKPGNLLPILGAVRSGSTQYLRNGFTGVFSACCPDRRDDANTDAAEFG